ncbi:hypothetical protein ACVWYN_000793 [Pedobacter sp. UYP24]
MVQTEHYQQFANTPLKSPSYSGRHQVNSELMQSYIMTRAEQGLDRIGTASILLRYKYHTSSQKGTCLV